MFNQKHESTAFTTYLAPDAFAQPIEIKQHDAALPTLLKTIYEDKKPDYDYDPKVGNTHPFKQQMEQLLKALHTWAQENKLAESYLLNITNFTHHLFAIAGEQQAPIFFSDIKQNLEKILSLLHEPDIPLLRKKSQLAELAAHFTMCGPGLYRHIESIRQTLESPISFSQWLAEHRNNLIYLFAEKHIANKKIAAGNEIHAHNAFLLHAVKKGWNPLTKINHISEHFLSTAKITPQIYQRFETEFLTQYTLDSIADFMTTAFIGEFHRQRKQIVGAKDDTNGWLPYDAQIDQLSKALLNTLDLNIEENFFDMEVKDKQAFIKFNSQRFKELFLKHCYEKGVLIPKSAWIKESIFNDYDLIHPDHPFFAHLAWLQNKKDGVVCSFAELPQEEKERYFSHSFSHYQSPDRFHLTEPLPLTRYFPSKESFQRFVKQLEKEETLVDNAWFFKDLLENNPLRLIKGLAILTPDSINKLLDAMEIDYSLLAPHHTLHCEVMALKDQALAQGEAKLAILLNERFEATAKKVKAFRKKIKEDKDLLPFENAEKSKMAGDFYFKLLNEADQATLKDQFIYHAFLKEYFPTIAANTALEKSAEAFKTAHEASLIQQHTILYSDLVKQADQATHEDQFIFNIYLKHYFPHASQSSLRPSEAFKKAHEDSLNKSPKPLNNRIQLLLTAIKDGKLNELIDAKLDLKEFCETTDRNGNSLARWANQTEQQAILNYYYQVASRDYSTDLSSETINVKRGLYEVPLLYWAILCRQKELVDDIFSIKELKIDTTSIGGRTPLHSAIRIGNKEFAKRLIEHKASIKRVKTNGETMLCLAAGTPMLAQYLVQQGADTDLARNDGRTSIAEAAVHGNLEMIKYLIKQGENIHIADNTDVTPFYFAVQGLYLETAAYLLKQKVNVDSAEENNQTALFIATCQGHQPIIKLLLEHHANPFIRSKFGSVYKRAPTPEIKKLILIAEIEFKLAEITNDKITESKECFSFFSREPVEFKAQQEALQSVLAALKTSMTKDQFNELLTTHPLLTKDPLKDFFDRGITLAAPSPNLGPVVPK